MGTDPQAASAARRGMAGAGHSVSQKQPDEAGAQCAVRR